MFIDDIDIPGVLSGITIRSPAAKGRLLRLECPELPDGYFLIQAKDIPGKNFLDDWDIPVLARDELNYSGEPVALIVGPERRKLEELAAATRVLAENGSPFFSRHSVPHGAVIAERHLEQGNPETAFAQARTVIEGRYSTGAQEHWYSEPAGAIAEWLEPAAAAAPQADAVPADGPAANGRGRIRIHAATQWAFQMRRTLAGVLGMAQDQVLIEPGSIGLHLDGKLWYPALLACHAALGALVSGKPVKVMLTRAEDFHYSPKRVPSEIRIRSALGEGGRLLAQEISLVCDMGAFGVFTDEILDRHCLGALGIYRQNCFKIDGKAVRTNIPPTGPFMGFGLAQGFFALESQAGLIAETLGVNPVEWRRDNAMNFRRPLAIGAALPDEPFIEKLLDTAAAMGDFHRKWASCETLRRARRTARITAAASGEKTNGAAGETLRGIGIAAAYQSGGFLHPGADRGIYTVELCLDKNSELEIRGSMVSSSAEYINIWRNLASEILSIEPGAVRVLAGNTDTVPDSGPAALSRNIGTITRLVELACQAIRKQRFRTPLPITVRRSTKPAKIPGWNRDAGGAESGMIDQNAFSRMGFGAAVVEVEVDPIEYSPKIRGVWMGINGGKILSQKQALRSVQYSVVQALGWASREILHWEEGMIPDALFRDYNLADPEEMPPVYIDFLWNDTSPSTGIDELAFNCVPAAYTQAVSQAMDFRFGKIPVTARDVWNAVQSLESGEEA